MTWIFSEYEEGHLSNSFDYDNELSPQEILDIYQVTTRWGFCLTWLFHYKQLLIRKLMRLTRRSK